MAEIKLRRFALFGQCITLVKQKPNELVPKRIYGRKRWEGETSF
jgi:hypothetical protein